jgi:putative heme degradation protein
MDQWIRVSTHSQRHPVESSSVPSTVGAFLNKHSNHANELVLEGHLNLRAFVTGDDSMIGNDGEDSEHVYTTIVL